MTERIAAQRGLPELRPSGSHACGLGNVFGNAVRVRQRRKAAYVGPLHKAVGDEKGVRCLFAIGRRQGVQLTAQLVEPPGPGPAGELMPDPHGVDPTGKKQPGLEYQLVSELARLLDTDQALIHPFVIGELACGNLARRQEILTMLQDLPAIPAAEDSEVLYFIGRNGLMTRGITLTYICWRPRPSLPQRDCGPETSVWKRQPTGLAWLGSPMNYDHLDEIGHP